MAYLIDQALESSGIMLASLTSFWNFLTKKYYFSLTLKEFLKRKEKEKKCPLFEELHLTLKLPIAFQEVKTATKTHCHASIRYFKQAQEDATTHTYATASVWMYM